MCTGEFMATAMAIYGSGLFTPKEVELMSITFEDSCTTCTRRARDGTSKARSRQA
jgi:hypothetical protein